ncbi:MAG: tyrosine-type recombinase/integrase [Nitrospirota bacterium]
MLRASPFRQITHLKEPPGKTRFLTDDEIKKLLEKLPAQAKAAVIVALNTGLRREECLGLRWESIDFENRVLTVYKTKSGKARSVPLNDAAIKALRGLKSWMTSIWVFPTDDGEAKKPAKKTKPTEKGESEPSKAKRPVTHTDPDNFYNRVFLPACRAAGLDDVTFHTLRHTFASHLAMSGTDLYTIQKLLGHSTLRMTERYAHLSPTYLKQAVANLPFGKPTQEETKGKADSGPVRNRDLERNQIPIRNPVPAQVLEKMVELRGIEPLTFRLPV